MGGWLSSLWDWNMGCEPLVRATSVLGIGHGLIWVGKDI